VTHLVERLSGNGVEAEVWHPDATNEDVHEKAVGDVRVIELPAYSRSPEVLRGLHPKAKAFVEQRRHHVDLVHLHSVFTPHNVFIARAVGRPYVVSPRGGYSEAVISGRHKWIKAGWMRFWERPFLRDAAALHAVSREEAEGLAELVPRARIVHVPNAVEVPAQTPARPRHDGTKRILFIGRLAIRQKGLDLLLEAYARFVGSSRVETELVIAGSDFRGGLAESARLSRSLSISDHVRFPGPVYGDAKTELLSTSHAFAHTSRWEGLPFAALEALAMGRPVLVTPETNLGRYVQEYEAGVVVAGTPEGIAEGLRFLIECDPPSLDAMSQNAVRLASEKFSWPEVTRQMVSLYEHVLADRSWTRRGD
jgi:glycosyltransferase involved in cell wall biosynthesis